MNYTEALQRIVWPLAFLASVLVASRRLGLVKPTNLSSLRLWFGGALGAFVDGFIDGFPIGGTGGAALGAVDGKMPSEATVPALAVGAAHILLVPTFTGIADIRAWKKDHPFPNIFGAPSPDATNYVNPPPQL